MAQPDWYSPEAVAVPSPVPHAAYELRPLTLGEILDRTFSVYRSRFWLFAGLASLSAGIQLVMSAIQLAATHALRQRVSQATLSVTSIVFLIVSALVFFLAVSVTQAATAFALSEVYLGKPVAIAESIRATIGRWYRYVAIACWQFGSGVWPPLVLAVPAGILMVLFKGEPSMILLSSIFLIVGLIGGYIVGFILYLRNALAVPASVIELLTTRQAMRRSKVLSAGAKGRMFVVLLISVALYLAVGMVQMPLAFFVGMATVRGGEAIGAQAGIMLVNFVGHSLVEPVAMIGLCLVYFDQRVRKEALDLVMLMGGEVAEPAMTPPPDWSAPSAATSPVAADEPVPTESPMQSATQTFPEPLPAEPEAAAERPTEDAGHHDDAPSA